MQDWQSIETAPKDGSKILLADYSGFAARGTDGVWICSGRWLSPEGYWWDGIERLYTPTHWQPLPTPPTPVV